MNAINVRTPDADWRPASRMFPAGGDDPALSALRIKILSDRRAEGGGIAYLLRITPPGKIIKTIAIARSDEHVYVLEGGYRNKAGAIIHPPGDYILNPAGHPHGVFVGIETATLVICRSEPDEVRELALIDPISDPARMTP